MFQKITAILLVGVLLFASSCASIVSKSSYPIAINSHPSGAKVTITDKKEVVVFNGRTPANLKLKSGSGFFAKARYQVKLEMDGYETKIVPVEFKIDGWYFGNVLFGGLIGLLIVDPATGAMYKLETEFVNETLTPTTASVQNEELKIYTLADIPAEWKKHLVVLNK